MKHGTMKMMLFAVVAVFSVNAVAASGKPLKVYILAGQSNMQGHAKDRTIPHMAGDPQTKPLHDKIVDKQGKPRIYTDVSVAAFSSGQKAGPLTVGFGAGLEDTDVLGTELAFGITMHETLNEPILIIKTAWGGERPLLRLSSAQRRQTNLHHTGRQERPARGGGGTTS